MLRAGRTHDGHCKLLLDITCQQKCQKCDETAMILANRMCFVAEIYNFVNIPSNKTLFPVVVAGTATRGQTVDL